MGVVFEGNQIAVGEYKMFTMPATAKTCEIQNLSHLALNISSNIQGTILILQPYESIPIDVQGNEQITFTLQTPILTANSQTGEYVQYKTSSVAYSGGITALALIPVYTTDVTVKSGSVDISGGTVTANIPAGTTVGLNGPVTVGSITETVTTSGAITNTFVPNNGLVFLGTITATFTNSSATVTNATAQLASPILVDGVVLFLQSADYTTPPYTLTFQVVGRGSSTGQVNGPTTSATSVSASYTANGLEGIGQLSAPNLCSLVQVEIAPTQTVTDTVTVDVYGIKANVTVENASTNPVQQQMAQTFNGSSVAGFVNTDGSQGTNTGTPFSLIPANTTNVTYFWLFYRNTGTSTQNILLSSAQSGGVNLFEDNIPAGGTLTIEWRMEGGGNLDAVWCTYSLASAGIINFMSNALEYPQNVTPTSVK